MKQTQFDGARTHIPLERKCGYYELYIKRLMDIVCSVAAIVVFSCCLLYTSDAADE